MAVGFILIITKPGYENSVREALENVPLVNGRWTVFGEYDIFVKIEADDENELTRCIIEDVRSIDGIVTTRTLIGAEV
ncbi:MAG: Lrp/AsnC ligand binding domain-containing protein [Candidatus Thermoplasmatota archaeon]|nr:Lrp/AsnC ligand binding domain-containing protein [Candidatus Thermoplasmatota archaeon]MEE3082941.1 Lrp/AsnC ligand binding domain-containing protein [Candidatus Thermoplasmatota archaeon]